MNLSALFAAEPAAYNQTACPEAVDASQFPAPSVPLVVTLYSKPGCHLCEEAKLAIAPILEETGFRLREVNIEDDTELTARFGWDIPVVYLGGRKIAKHRVDLAQFRRQLAEAREQSSA